MQGSKLYVGNLPHIVSTRDLEELFSRYGKVKEAKVISNKGFAFVEMSSQSEAETAKGALNGYELNGFILSVQPAKLPKQKTYGRGRR